MHILGIGDVTHDKSVCLMKDNSILTAIEEERLTRIKHGLKLDPNKYTILQHGAHVHGILDSLTAADREEMYSHYINYCLEPNNLTMDDIDCMVVSSLHPNLPFRHKAVFLNHHVAHCASAFYPSSFKEAAILVIDGYGTHTDGLAETVMYATGNNNKLQVLDTIEGTCDFTEEEKKQVSHRSHMVFKNSPGVFYQNITMLIGMEYHGEGKTMGLSAYGEDNPKLNIIKDYIEFLPNGKLAIDNRKIFLLCKKLIEETQHTLDEKALFKLYADLAFIHQQLLEEMVFYLCNHLYKLTNSKSICLAGGVALNSVANGKILAKTPFKKLFVQPAAGDNGISIGCAMYGAHALLKIPRNLSRNKFFSPYVGKKYDNYDIDTAFEKYKDDLIEETDFTNAEEIAAELISQGKIVGWFNESCEIGPRALGNRSILADPRLDYMKDHLNAKVKHRESFRPFAPAILLEEAANYFDVKLDNPSTPYMLFVADTHEKVKDLIPAVVHVDESARLQTVSQNTSPTFHNIIKHFQKITGIPIVLNTSFNDAGEPIVETPEDAMKCFLNTGIDYLFINKRLFHKKTAD